MNPASIIKLLGAKKQFKENHPKFVSFIRTVCALPPEEGAVLEVTLTRPGENPLTANMKLKPSDLELLAELRKLTE